jgi:hypothetical protein
VSDRELLELAAKAAGMEIEWRKWVIDPKARTLGGCCFALVGTYTYWNPLTDDGDALRLAVKLFDGDDMEVIWYRAKLLLAECPQLGRVAATRRAIVRAAAEIGRNMT